MGGGQNESKDWATLTMGNLTDHMLTFTQTNTDKLLTEAGEIKYVDYEIQSFLQGMIPKFHKIITLTTSNMKTSGLLTKYVNELMDEVLEPPDLFSTDLARECFKRVTKGINKALWGAGAMKETAFLKVIMSMLSRINIADERIIVPSAVLDQLKAMDELED